MRQEETTFLIYVTSASFVLHTALDDY